MRRWFQSDGVKIAISAGVANGLGVGATTAVLYSLFMPAMTREWGWTRTQYTGLGAIAPLVVVAVVSWMGRAIDRWGARAIVVPGKVGFCLAVMSLALMRPSYLVVAAAWIVFGFFAATQGPAGYVKAISSYFGKNRGLVLSLSLGVGASIGGVIVSLVIGHTIQHYGWRTGYVVMGGLPLVIAAPLLWAWFRPALPDKTTATTESPVAPQGMLASEARRSRPFWLIVTGSLLHMFSLGAILAHGAPMLTDRGFTIEFGGVFMAVLLVVAGVSRFVCGYTLDRIESPKVGLPYFAAALVGVALLPFVHDKPTALLAAAAIGVGYGGEGTLVAYYTSRYFGLRSIGEVFANFYTIQILSGAFAPLALAIVFDKTGSYTLGLGLLIAALALGVVIIALLGPYTYAKDGRRFGADGEPAGKLASDAEAS